MLTPDTKTMASLSVGLSGLLWGLFWIPMRAMETAGLGVGSATVLLYLGGCVFMIPAALRHHRELRGEWGAAFLTALFSGGAFALYTLALVLTDVTRAILLFYLTPAWGALLGWLLLGERLTALRLVGLVSGLLGLLIVFRVDEQFPWPRNIGDALSLTAGFIWAYGSLRLYSVGERHSTGISTFMFFVGGLVVSLVTVAALDLGLVPATPRGFPSAAFLAALVVFTLPGVFLTLWGASRLSAMRVGILLMGEVAVGVVSSAVLTDEPFGLREAVGACLVVGAGLFEVLGQRDGATTAPDAPSG